MFVAQTRCIKRQAAGRRRLGELDQQAQVVAAENAREQQILTTNQQQLAVQQQQLGVLLQMLERLGGRGSGPAPIPPITRWVPPAASPTPRGVPNLPIVRPPIISVPAPIPPRGAAGGAAADVDISDPAASLAGSAMDAKTSLNRGMNSTVRALGTARNALDGLSNVANQSVAEIDKIENGMDVMDNKTQQIIRKWNVRN